jgi:adenine/guanine phosphoribosyltransferase-like PRPP-binding protein
MTDIPKTTATADDVLDALAKAHAAMMDAAAVMARRYGHGNEKSVQLCGAALMISNDWSPAIEMEEEPANAR